MHVLFIDKRGWAFCILFWLYTQAASLQKKLGGIFLFPKIIIIFSIFTFFFTIFDRVGVLTTPKIVVISTLQSKGVNYQQLQKISFFHQYKKGVYWKLQELSFFGQNRKVGEYQLLQKLSFLRCNQKVGSIDNFKNYHFSTTIERQRVARTLNYRLNTDAAPVPHR